MLALVATKTDGEKKRARSSNKTGRGGGGRGACGGGVRGETNYTALPK